MSLGVGTASRKTRAPRPGAASRIARTPSVQRHIDAISKGDYATAVADAQDDVELDVFAPREFSWTRRARGRAALLAAIEHNFGTVKRHRTRIGTVLAQGDVVLLFGREQGRIRESGKPYDLEFVHRFTFLEGRLASLRIIAAKAVRGLKAHVAACGGAPRSPRDRFRAATA